MSRFWDDDDGDGVARSVIELGDGATTPCLYKAPMAFLKTALLTPGNSLLISSGEDLSPIGNVPPGADCNRDIICELNPSALAFPPKARRPISNFPSSSLYCFGSVRIYISCQLKGKGRPERKRTVFFE